MLCVLLFIIIISLIYYSCCFSDEEESISGENQAKIKSLKMKGLLHYNRNRLVPAAACYEKALNMVLQLNDGSPTGQEYTKILESLNKCRHKMGKGEYGEEEQEEDDEW
jgi:hypothetical protein